MFVADWAVLLKRAWSIRLILLASVLSAAEAVLPFLFDLLPPGLLAALTVPVTFGALFARLLAQKELKK